MSTTPPILQGVMNPFTDRIHFTEPSFSRLLKYVDKNGTRVSGAEWKLVYNITLRYTDLRGRQQEVVSSFRLHPTHDHIGNISTSV